MDYYERKFRGSGGTLKACWYSLVACVIALIIAAIFSGCKTITKTEVVEKVRIDTAYVTKVLKDSVWMHDSIHVKEKGDTILIEKWHTQWRDRLQIDTIYRAKVDSIPVPYEVEKLVERQLTWWQRLRLALGNVMLMFIIAAVIYGVYRIRKRF